MKRALCRMVLLAAVLPAFGVARAEEPAGVVRVYELHNIKGFDAMMKIQAACPDCLADVREMIPQGEEQKFLRVKAPLPVQEKLAKMIADVDAPPAQARFQVIVIDAFDKSLPPPDLPATVRAALDDVRTLFPFKGYSIRHTALLNTGVRALARLGSDYTVTMYAEPRQEKTFFVRDFNLRRPSNEAILANDFPIRLGETVVLGVSQTPPSPPDPDAPRALIVLVTALP